jgi:type III secretion protein C
MLAVSLVGIRSMKQKKYVVFLLAFLLSLTSISRCEEVNEKEPPLYTVHFQDVPIVEFIRFVSKISKENFIFNNEDLDFNITFSSGQPITADGVIRALVRLLQLHNFQASRENGYLVVHKIAPGQELMQGGFSPSSLLASSDDSFIGKRSARSSFSVYKLQYHEGAEILDALKKIGGDLSAQGGASPQLLQAIQTLQWVKTTNSLLFSGDEQTVAELTMLISSLDTPLRQVFIEVLVVETDVQKGLDFGLQWAASGQYGTRLGGGMGNFVPSPSGNSFTNIMQGINATNTPTGLNQVPVVPGFDLGVIGDIITHKGTSFLSLGSLVSALQMDKDSTIVLNQKIITQDNKHSRIFVGDNIPFTGSVVTTVGQSQQTTANIEYRDVGVSLNITPKLGEGDVITLSLDEEITEAVYDGHTTASNVNGIRTTKTNMLTHVHVPDKHFLVLSGMIRNAKATHKTGIPCLGGIPWIGALFSRSKKQDEKRNVIIFVRPQIIHSFEEYSKITQNQEKLFERQANAADFEKAMNLLPPCD